jgi:uncharacterized membrane protein YbhN (UPF0104 family)
MAALAPWLRLGVSLGLLVGLALWLDVDRLWVRLAALEPGWVLLALAIGVVQMAASAWRWQFTARRLGAPLTYADALQEYYLGSFLNQILPGGVLGDAARAVRHGRSAGTLGAAIRAVVLERASGQIALLLLATAAIATSPALLAALGTFIAGVDTSLPAMLLVFMLIGGLLCRRHPRLHASIQRFASDARQALFSARALPWQLASSLLVVSTYLAVYLAAARALGITTAPLDLLAPICLSLLAMVVPLSVAGWGLREAVAAIAWPLAGLAAVDGVAISIVYGVLVLVSSLPGVWVLLVRRGAARSAIRAPAAAGPPAAGGPMPAYSRQTRLPR